MYIYTCSLHTAAQLKERWDRAFSDVNQKKNQLDDMLLECRQFDELYAEFERWLSSVEEELDNRPLRPQAPTDMEALIKEHKVGVLSFHMPICSWSEINTHQWAAVNNKKNILSK